MTTYAFVTAGGASVELDFMTIRGSNGALPATATGLQVGDTVLRVLGILPIGMFGDQSGDFEATITVANQIQQLNGLNLSNCQYLVIVTRPA